MLYEYKIFNDNQVIILILIVRVMVNPLFDALFNRESTIKKWRCFLTINSRAPIALWFGLKMFYSWSLYSSHANLPSQKPILFSNIPNHLFLVFMIGKFFRITRNWRLHRCKWQVDVGDFMLVIIFGCWWHNFDMADIFWMLVPDANVGDKNHQNCHQHIKVVANTFGLQHPSSTSM